MNRIVFVIFVLLGMSSGPQAQATDLPLFQKAFLVRSIEIAGVVSPTDGYQYSGTCIQQLPAVAEFGANHVNRLNQTLPFDVNIDGAESCDVPMSFNYINLIVTGQNLAQAQMELGYNDSDGFERHKVFVNVSCTAKINPSNAADRTELDCVLASGNGSGMVTFAAQD